MARAGRKPIYTNDELINLIQRYKLNYPEDKQITIADISREFGISYSLLKQNKVFRQALDKIKEPPIFASNKIQFIMPNARNLVETHYNNKEQLVYALDVHFQVFNDLLDYANAGLKAKEQEKHLNERIQELKAELDERDVKIKKLHKEIDMLYIHSNSELDRNKLGISENMIASTPKNIISMSKIKDDLKKEYPGIF